MKLLLCVTVLCVTALSSCGLPPKMTLEDIDPVRVYNTDKKALYDLVRMFGTKENYKIERFEMESGSIKGHKVLQARNDTRGPLGVTGERLHLVMNLKFESVSPTVTKLTASFAYVEYYGTHSSEDEGILVSEYTNFFSYLDEELKK
jgi:hypothetical protein